MNESIGKYMRSALRVAPLIMATSGLAGCGKAVVECGTPSALIEEFNTKAAEALIKTSDDISKGKATYLPSGELAFIQDTQNGTHIVAGASFDPGEGGGGIYKEANRQVLTYASDAPISITYSYGLSLYNFAGGSVNAEKDFHPDSLELWNHTYNMEQYAGDETKSN